MRSRFFYLIVGLFVFNVVIAGPDEDLVDAIKSKNLEALKGAIAAGADVNQFFEHTLINWQLGAYQTYKKFTPLMLACYNGYYEGVLHLLHAKAKPNVKANGGVGAYFNIFPLKGVKSVTALHFAAGNGHHEVVKLLMQVKAHKTLIMMELSASSHVKQVGFVKGKANYSPKSWAQKNGHEKTVALWKEAKKAEWAKSGLPAIN